MISDLRIGDLLLCLGTSLGNLVIYDSRLAMFSAMKFVNTMKLPSLIEHDTTLLVINVNTNNYDPSLNSLAGPSIELLCLGQVIKLSSSACNVVSCLRKI